MSRRSHEIVVAGVSRRERAPASGSLIALNPGKQLRSEAGSKRNKFVRARWAPRTELLDRSANGPAAASPEQHRRFCSGAKRLGA
jgi:hypothetical protein